MIKQLIRRMSIERLLSESHDIKNCPFCKYCLEHDYMILKSNEMNVAFLNTQLNKDKLGIENIKESFSIIYDYAQETKSIVKDFDWLKAGAFALKLAKFEAYLPIFKSAIAEAKDLDDKEVTELNDHFKHVIDLENDELEAVIEEGLDNILETYEFIKTGIALGGKWQKYYPKLKNLNKKAAA